MSALHIISKKPLGLPTRGKTASNRLRRVDNFILLYEPSLLTQTPAGDQFQKALVVDLGYGFDARTTLESAARFRRVNPTLPILGVEIDKERVASALPHADAITHFRVGGFNLPLLPGESVRLIRAFNVLRQYEEKDFLPAYEMLAHYVLPGGLMIEGTSNPFGSLWVANLARRSAVTPSREAAKSPGRESAEILRPLRSRKETQNGWKMEALVFSTNFRMGFDVTDFQAVLPKNYIHHVVPGELIYNFLEAWKHSAAETSAAKTFGLKQWFSASVESLAAKGYKIDLRKKWLTKGWLIWNL
jgi:hypothetical protein